MTTRDQHISDMLDREAIRDLPVRYCHYVRTRALDPIVDLFTDDAEFGMNTGLAAVKNGTWKGRDGLREGFAHGFKTTDPWPFVHNHVIDLHGPDRASGYVYVEIRMTDQNMRTSLVVVYEDEYVKDQGRWKFKSRNLKITPIPA